MDVDPFNLPRLRDRENNPNLPSQGKPLVNITIVNIHNVVSHLVGKYSNNNIPGTENIDNAINELLVGCLWHVSLKANIRKLFLWSNVNSHVAALKQRK